MDHRAVPLDVLREFARDEAERSSLRQVAASLGLGRTTLQKFIAAETTPHPRVRRLVALRYLESRGQGKSEPERIPLAVTSAFGVLLETIPEARRRAAVTNLAGVLERLHAESGSPPPGWVVQLRASSPEDVREGAE